jgi:DNA-binding CsgD family transcriptional regulator
MNTQAALCAVVQQLGRPDFQHQALAALQPVLRAGSWSVYSLRPQQRPALHLSATWQGADHTQACFQAYAQGLYLRDNSFDPVRRLPAQPLVSSMRAEAAPTPEHRDAVYRAHGILERLSVAAVQPDGSLLAVNLYHHDHQGPFQAAERQAFTAMAPLLHSLVCKHLELAAGPADARAALLAAAPALTARELDVCERLLRGWSHYGIASDLGLSLATVKTYRSRAFARLGLHFRSELFARFGVAARGH